MPRRVYLDGWRGLAITALLIGHFDLLPTLAWGNLGVELFFVLSGRLMAELLFVRPVVIRDYILRRFSRVWPGLAIFVLTMLVLTPMLGGLGFQPLGPGWALAAVTFTLGYARVWVSSGIGTGHLGPLNVPVIVSDAWRFFHSGNFVIGHVWSLCVEEHAYLVLVLILLAARRYGGTTAWIALLGLGSILDGLVRSLILGQTVDQAYFVTDAKLCSILVPCVLYLQRDRLTALAGRAAPFASGAFALAGALLFSHHVPMPVTQALAPLMLGIAVVMLPHAPSWMLALLEARPIARIGIWSYSLYLWQQPFTEFANSAPARMSHPWLTTICCLALAMLTGLISFYVIEQPLRRWLNQRLTPARSSRMAAGA